VPQIILNGTVNGDVTVSGRIELGASAKVVGNVYYHLIEMAAGAEVNGQLIHEEQPRTPALVTHQGSVREYDARRARPNCATADSGDRHRGLSGPGGAPAIC
jgi:cytoskeletal protein CcmA (bactofilin family)